MNIRGSSTYSLGVLLTTFKVLVLCVRTVPIVNVSGELLAAMGEEAYLKPALPISHKCATFLLAEH